MEKFGYKTCFLKIHKHSLITSTSYKYLKIGGIVAHVGFSHHHGPGFGLVLLWVHVGFLWVLSGNIPVGGLATLNSL